MYFSGRCFSLWMKLIMYSHMGERWMRYTKRPFSSLAYSVCGEPRGGRHSAGPLPAPRHPPQALRAPPSRSRAPTHLHLLHHLLAEGAHLGGDADGHALGRAVLGADPVEGSRALLDGAVEVRLEEERGVRGRPRGGVRGAGRAAHLGVGGVSSPRT